MIRSIGGGDAHPPIAIEEVTDPAEIAEHQRFHAAAGQNWQVIKDRLPQLAEGNRGRYLCVAGREVFIADTPEEARRLAMAAHPDEIAPVHWRFRVSNNPLIYAHSR